MTADECESAIVADLRIAEERAEKANQGWLAQAERDAEEIVRLEAERDRLCEELADLRAYYDTVQAWWTQVEVGGLMEIVKRIEARRAAKTKEKADE